MLVNGNVLSAFRGQAILNGFPSSPSRRIHIAVEQQNNEQNKKRLNKSSVTIYRDSAYATSFHLQPPST